MKKKITVIVLSALMAFSMIPTSLFRMASTLAFATEGVEVTQRTEALDLTTQETADNTENEGWAWDKDSKTLMLDGLDLSVTVDTAITVPDGTTIILAAGSTNKIETTHTKGYGISAQGSLTIKSANEENQGALNVNVPNHGIKIVKNPVVTEAEFIFSNIKLNTHAKKGIMMNAGDTIRSRTLTLAGVTYKYEGIGDENDSMLEIWPNYGDATLIVKDSDIVGDGEMVVAVYNANTGDCTLTVENSTVNVASNVFVQKGKKCTMSCNDSSFTTEASLLIGGGGIELAKVTVIDSSVTTGSKWTSGNNSFEIGNGTTDKAEVTFINSTITSIDGTGQPLKIETKEGGTKDVDISNSTFFLAGLKGENLALIPEGNDFTVVALEGQGSLGTDSDGNKTLTLPAGTTITSGNTVYTVVEGGSTMTYDAEEGAMTIPAGTQLALSDGSTIVSDGALTFGVGEAPTMAAGVTTAVTKKDGTTIAFKPVTNNDSLAFSKNENGESEVIVPEGATTYKYGTYIQEMNVSLGQDLSMNYYVKCDEEGTAKMRFTVNGKSTEVEGKKDGEQLRFTFGGITPQMIGDTILVEFMLGDETKEQKEDSVLTYLNRLKDTPRDELGYSEPKYEAMQALINDLLVYGGAAQRYRNYKTDKPVDAGVTGTEFTKLTETDSKVENGDNVVFTGATVFFDSVNKLKFRFTATNLDGIVFKVKVNNGDEEEISYTDNGDGTYIIETKGISAVGFDDVYTVTAYSGDEAGSTLTYSVKSYVKSKQDKEDDIAELAKAIYNYGLSAKAYRDAE